MGLELEKKRIYVNTFQDFFTVRTKEDDPNGVARVNKAGNTVHELRYTKLVGRVSFIEVKEAKDEKYDDQLQITMIDGDDEFVLCLGVFSGFAFAFYQRMEQINFMEPVTLSTFIYNDRYYMGITQNGERLASGYNKEDIPQWKEVTVSGRTIWDKTDAFEFFKKKIDEVIKQVALAGNTKKDVRAKQTELIGEDDLPF